MNKPFTLLVQELEQKIVEDLNNSQLPNYNKKIILMEFVNQLEAIDNEDVKKYMEEQKKESDKKCKK